MTDPNINNSIRSHEFDMFVDQMKQEHVDNQAELKEIKDKIDKNSNKLDKITGDWERRLQTIEKTKDRDHKVFYIWLAVLTATFGGGSAGMFLIH